MKTPPKTNQNTPVKKKTNTKVVKWVVTAAASSAVAMNWGVGFAAIGFCAVIGVLFGGYPAAKASRLQPIDALHTT